MDAICYLLRVWSSVAFEGEEVQEVGEKYLNEGRVIYHFAPGSPFGDCLRPVSTSGVCPDEKSWRFHLQQQQQVSPLENSSTVMVVASCYHF